MTVVVAHDATQGNIGHLPPGQACGYTTGSPDIKWTAQSWAAHPGAVRICQDAGATDTTADVLDVERGAATPADCPGWADKAQASFAAKTRPGQRTPAIYTSASNVTNVVNALTSGGVHAGVSLWVANWSISEGTAVADLLKAAGPFPVIGYQFSSEAYYDTDVFSEAWLSHVSGATTTPLVTVPVTYGEPANEAIAHITAVGLTVATNPARNPAHTYISIGSRPAGGAQLPKGSHVILNVRET